MVINQRMIIYDIYQDYFDQKIFELKNYLNLKKFSKKIKAINCPINFQTK
jgi:hypothetical protein